MTFRETSLRFGHVVIRAGSLLASIIAIFAVVSLAAVFVITATGGAASSTPPGESLAPTLEAHNPIEAVWYGTARDVAIIGASFGYANKNILPFWAWRYVAQPLLLLGISLPIVWKLYLRDRIRGCDRSCKANT